MIAKLINSFGLIALKANNLTLACNVPVSREGRRVRELCLETVLLISAVVRRHCARAMIVHFKGCND